ncbi:HNH endonuclease signature motif containing protein [Jongsikchunia kroppenstedtii]|uniref:HNH endonuclease signature motif containing protein n=1 Tax=Jongsikchunia kroppenstedtii TaxID=1121721 RepID=UPI0012DE0548|nr:HNH endonuclease signature motif containing protein [Jongsikchunia kroppenstedtii]
MSETAFLSDSVTGDALLDAGLSVVELVSVTAHCAQVRGAADYRMLQAISLIHEQREDEYLAEVAARCEAGTPREADSLAEMRSPRERFGLTGLERAVAEVGAVLYLTPQRAKKLIAAASAARYRLPETALALANGVIDLDRLMMAIGRTDLVGFQQVRDLDIDLAGILADRGPMSTRRFQALVDQLICRYDPDAVRRRAARAEADRNITIGPDRFNAGQARISGTLPKDKAAVINARLTAMAAEVHAGDGRTRAQLRADAYVALAQGEQHLGCRCADCATTDAGTTDAAPPAADEGCGHRVRPVMHVVVNLSTLAGLDDDPAYVDGQGVIDADTARGLLAEAERRYVTPPREDAEAAARRYRPSRTLRALIRAGELCCQAPGCNNPVSEADLDHQRSFAAGGRTIRRNLASR